MTENSNTTDRPWLAPGSTEYMRGDTVTPEGDYVAAETYDGAVRSYDELRVKVETLTKQLNESYAANRMRSEELRRFMGRVQSAIHEFVSDGELGKETANEVLEDLGLEKVAVEYRGTVTVEFHVRFESADGEADIESALYDVTPELTASYGELDLEVVDTSIADVTFESDE